MDGVNVLSNEENELLDDIFKKIGQYYLDAGICYSDDRPHLFERHRHNKGWVPDIGELKEYLIKN